MDYSDDSDYTCPLCMEEMDMTDRKFQPCQCGYQVGKYRCRKLVMRLCWQSHASISIDLKLVFYEFGGRVGFGISG